SDGLLRLGAEDEQIGRASDDRDEDQSRNDRQAPPMLLLRRLRRRRFLGGFGLRFSHRSSRQPLYHLPTAFDKASRGSNQPPVLGGSLLEELLRQQAHPDHVHVAAVDEVPPASPPLLLEADALVAPDRPLIDPVDR